MSAKDISSDSVVYALMLLEEDRVGRDLTRGVLVVSSFVAGSAAPRRGLCLLYSEYDMRVVQTEVEVFASLKSETRKGGRVTDTTPSRVAWLWRASRREEECCHPVLGSRLLEGRRVDL